MKKLKKERRTLYSIIQWTSRGILACIALMVMFSVCAPQFNPTMKTVLVTITNGWMVAFMDYVAIYHLRDSKDMKRSKAILHFAVACLLVLHLAFVSHVDEEHILLNLLLVLCGKPILYTVIRYATKDPHVWQKRIIAIKEYIAHCSSITKIRAVCAFVLVGSILFATKVRMVPTFLLSVTFLLPAIIVADRKFSN